MVRLKITNVLILITIFPFSFGLFFYFDDINSLYIFSKIIYPLIAMIFTYMLILAFMLKRKMYKYTLWIFFVFLFLVSLSAIRSNLVFDQNLFYGFIGQVKLLPFFFYFMLLYILKSRNITLHEIERSFVIIINMSVIIYYAISILFSMNIINFSPEEYHFVSYDVNRGYRIILPMFFIIFGTFYYFQKFLDTHKLIHLFLFTLFYFYILYFIQVRFIIIGILLTLFIVLFFRMSIFYKLLILIISVLALLTLITFVPYVSSALDGSDSSVNLRLYTTLPIIVSTISNVDNFLFGVGFLNKLSGVTLQDIYGEHFWPVDVGFLGVIFELGLVGLLVISSVYYIIYREIKKVSNKDSTIVLTIKMYLIYILITCWWASPIPFNIGGIISLFTIIVYYNRYYLKCNSVNYQLKKKGKFEKI